LIVTLTPDAEPAAVARKLAGMGLWVRHLEDDPGSALSDESQALPPERFGSLVAAIVPGRSR
jgi:3-deoxy-D-arabino-heptulosonate 7-phosphate (DAHP) synthase